MLPLPAAQPTVARPDQTQSCRPPTLPLPLCIIAFRALAVDAGKVGLLIGFRGVAVLPIMVYMVPSGAVVLPQSLLDGSRWRHPAFVRNGISEAF